MNGTCLRIAVPYGLARLLRKRLRVGLRTGATHEIAQVA